MGRHPETACARESLVANPAAGIPAPARRGVGRRTLVPRWAAQIPLALAGAGECSCGKRARGGRAGHTRTTRDALLGTLRQGQDPLSWRAPWVPSPGVSFVIPSRAEITQAFRPQVLPWGPSSRRSSSLAPCLTLEEARGGEGVEGTRKEQGHFWGHLPGRWGTYRWGIPALSLKWSPF